eukprot:902769-Pelagomonas_calceolata.AAC.2
MPVLTECALPRKHHNPGVLEPHAARNPPVPHQRPSYLLVKETHGSLSQRVVFSVMFVGSVLAAYVIFSFSHSFPLPTLAPA